MNGKRILLSLLFCICALAALSAKTVKVGYYFGNPSLMDGFADDERKSGFAYEYLQEIAVHAGWDYEYVYGSMADIVSKLEKGEVDIAAGIPKNEKNEERMLFSSFFIDHESYAVHVKADDWRVDSSNPSSLNGMTIAIMAQMRQSLAKFKDENNLDINVAYAPSLENAVDLVLRSKVDGCVLPDGYSTEKLKAAIAIGYGDLYFAVSKDRADVLYDLERANTEILGANPLFQVNLHDRYFSSSALSESISKKERQYLDEKGYLKFGFVSGSMPISDASRDGKPNGFVKDLIEMVASFAEVPIEPVCYEDVDAMQGALLSGEIDAAFPIFSDAWTSERKGLLQTSAVLSEKVMAVYRGVYRENLMSKIAIGRHTIGQRGYVDIHYPDSEVIFCETREDYFNAVLNGVAECSVGCSSILQRFMKENPKYAPLNIAYIDNTEDFSIGTRRDEGVLRGILEKAVIGLSAADRTSMMLRYAGVREEATFSDFISGNMVFVVSAATLVVAVVFFLLGLLVVKGRTHQRMLQGANEALVAAREKLKLSLKKEQDYIKKMGERYSIINTLAGRYICTYYVNIAEDTFEETSSLGFFSGRIGKGGVASEALKVVADEFISPDYYPAFSAFADLSTIRERLMGSNSVSVEVQGRRLGWLECVFVTVDRDEKGCPLHVIFAATDINQRKEGELESKKALEMALSDANKANEAKTAFLRNMSHDIRTPLNAILGMSAIASAHVDDSARVSDCLKKIDVSGRHLLGLINEILDMSKIESGNVDLSEEFFTLSDVIDASITMTRPQAEAHKHHLTIKGGDIVHEKVIGDSLRLQEVFTNIISNAVKYTPDGGMIELEISEKPSPSESVGAYEFTCSDNGIGMKKEFLPHIFDAFSMADSSDEGRSKGSGLGMAISKSIIKMMGGDIKVESEYGKGSKFIVLFLLRLQDDITLDADALKGKKVLVCDDNEDTCSFSEEILTSLGIDCTCVLSGHDAIRKAEEGFSSRHPYDVIILDWRMPDMGGLETAKRIRGLDGGEGAKIAIMSAYDWAGIESEAKEAGIDAFIGKPLFRSRFLQLFMTLFGGDVDGKCKEEEAPSYKGKRALLAEDNDLNAEIAKEFLSNLGFDVEWVTDGSKAVEAFSLSVSGYYDCIFMDVQMPVMNGYDATKAIRVMDRLDSKVPIFAMTANAFVDDVKDAFSAGMNGHVSKPLDHASLVRMLKKHL